MNIAFNTFEVSYLPAAIPVLIVNIISCHTCCSTDPEVPLSRNTVSEPIIESQTDAESRLTATEQGAEATMKR
jgi:hypothetical protein